MKGCTFVQPFFIVSSQAHNREITMSLKKLILILASFFAMPLAHATDNNDAYAIKGAGITSCSNFIKSAQNKDKTLYIYGGWIEGYFTASNQHFQDTFDLAPWQTTQLLLKIVESVCTKNPSLKFHQVLNSMAVEMGKQRLNKGGKFVKINDSLNYVLQEEVIARMKHALKAKGYYSGEINGTYGDSIKTAIKRFQKEVGQPETGLPDQGTLYELFKPNQ